ncbi:hypothetical protein ACSBR2_010721 [Camellia fascicularis]
MINFTTGGGAQVDYTPVSQMGEHERICYQFVSYQTLDTLLLNQRPVTNYYLHTNGLLLLLFFILLIPGTIKLSSCIEIEKQALKLKQGLTDPSDSFDIIGTSHELGSGIDSSLLDLKYLSYLDLSMNNFGGIQIPTFFRSLTKLRYLNLSGASFRGTILPHLGNISNLLYLDLSSLFAELNDNDLKWISSLSS